MYEVGLWQIIQEVEAYELFYANAVDNQAIVIPETIDAIRGMNGLEASIVNSIRKTNKSSPKRVLKISVQNEFS